MQHPWIVYKPADEFETWNHKTLARFASDATWQMVQQSEAIEQLRADLRDAMELLRKHNAGKTT